MELTCDRGISLMCVVSSPFFDAVAAALIMFNSFVVGWETEWLVYNTTEHPTIQVLSSFCNWIFLIELLLRIAAFKCDFFYNRERRNWNILAGRPENPSHGHRHFSDIITSVRYILYII